MSSSYCDFCLASWIQLLQAWAVSEQASHRQHHLLSYQVNSTQDILGWQVTGIESLRNAGQPPVIPAEGQVAAGLKQTSNKLP